MLSSVLLSQIYIRQRGDLPQPFTPHYTISNSIRQQQKLKSTGQNQQVFVFLHKIKSLELAGCWHQLCHLTMPSKTQILSLFLHSFYFYHHSKMATSALSIMSMFKAEGKGKGGSISFSRSLPPVISSQVSVVHRLHDT